MLNLSIPKHVEPIRAKVLKFVEQEVYPVEDILLGDRTDERRGETMRGLMQKAKDEGLWALGHLKKLAGAAYPLWIMYS